jgi:hypothetical protein
MTAETEEFGDREVFAQVRTDTLVDLLTATVHRINARAETKVVGEVVAELNLSASHFAAAAGSGLRMKKSHMRLVISVLSAPLGNRWPAW